MRDWAWDWAWLAESVQPGMVGDLIGRIRSGDVRKHKAYVERAVKDAADKAGFDWAVLLNAKPPCPPKPDRLEKSTADFVGTVLQGVPAEPKPKEVAHA